MKKGVIYGIGAVLVVIVVAIIMIVINSNNKNEKSLKKSEDYLENPELYMDELKEKYEEEDHDSEGEHDHEHSHDAPTEEQLKFYEQEKQKYLKEERLVLTDENYIVLMNLIDRYPAEFEGKKIELNGFIYREPTFMEGQFVIGRQEDPCCTEEPDAIYGILSTVLNANNFQDGQWVKATGELTKSTYQMSEIPFLLVEGIEKIEAPSEPYVKFE
ncbi:TIGR03943 family protein [Bacillus sp. BGMRC 2118]|nr:TIGR03943 family protein [Bacillus sp. BGMRC 2118]